MGVAFALVLAVAPSMLMLRYFVRSDAFPEPRRAITITFLWGVGSTAPAVGLSLVLLFALDGLGWDGVSNAWVRGGMIAFGLAAIPEELLKFAVLYLYCRRLAAFDEPMDGIVYGVTASLGFATLENVLYVAQGGVGVAIARGLTAVPGHAIFGAVMGFYFGLAYFEPERRRRLLMASLLVPMLMHGVYDLVLLSPEEGADPLWRLLVFPVLAFGLLYSRRLHRRLRERQRLLLAPPGTA